ncbi:signal peptide, CUB and EGF-like domain-containing protein 2 [Ostrea edulis]|uniref:signal peptide, CUB and EGF-like domain-containing protein 2 n=1 Tax=Ostrea edulis TaxID=37623 RepID=UPI0024AF8F69|nr:signal peptide, CUB and EGF-like domain-containing protein 2 [Ostrea edulis]
MAHDTPSYHEHCVEGMELTSFGTCEDCAIGFYKNISSADNLAPIEKRWNCSECDNNKTTFYKGTLQAADCISNCVEGMFWNDNQCLACPVGFYKSASSESHHIPSHSRWNCTTCPAGTTTFSTGSTHCIDHCKTGYHLDNETCIPCDIGFYKNTSSEDESLEETLRWNCTQCPKGQTTNSSGAEFCIRISIISYCFNATTDFNPRIVI